MQAKKKLKPYYLDEKKVKRAQRILGVETEKEAVEQALQIVLDNESIDRAHRKLIESGITIVDTLGRLPPA